jgi:hypothetical protein
MKQLVGQGPERKVQMQKEDHNNGGAANARLGANGLREDSEEDLR